MIKVNNKNNNISKPCRSRMKNICVKMVDKEACHGEKIILIISILKKQMLNNATKKKFRQRK